MRFRSTINPELVVADLGVTFHNGYAEADLTPGNRDLLLGIAGVEPAFTDEQLLALADAADVRVATPGQPYPGIVYVDPSHPAADSPATVADPGATADLTGAGTTPDTTAAIKAVREVVAAEDAKVEEPTPKDVKAVAEPKDAKVEEPTPKDVKAVAEAKDGDDGTTTTKRATTRRN